VGVAPGADDLPGGPPHGPPGHPGPNGAGPHPGYPTGMVNGGTPGHPGQPGPSSYPRGSSGPPNYGAPPGWRPATEPPASPWRPGPAGTRPQDNPSDDRPSTG
jgi:cell division protease FtsH